MTGRRTTRRRGLRKKSKIDRPTREFARFMRTEGYLTGLTGAGCPA